MVIKRQSINERLKSLDTVLTELNEYRPVTFQQFQSQLALQWIVERGIIAAAALILDIADHILAEKFTLYPATYEESLLALKEQGVTSNTLYQQIKGLGGFRNVLVHMYQEIDTAQVWANWHKGMDIFPLFMSETQQWLESQP